MSDANAAYIRGVCQAFLKALPEPKIADKNLFNILESEARKLGWRIAAHQQGVHGTYIRFERCEANDNES